MIQTDFFELVDDDREDIPGALGVVFPIDASRWQAQIDSGWWVAYGTTKAAAIKAVTKRYYDEWER